ncbi:ABC transporter substrate-binding protein [Mycetocola lacteus]|uniref:ABC transporter substrate-binding protein n=1 Tax=Mycetocola lacteus TaxID=76637 RepID=A0A3L7AHF9_9MICO|nr:MULTISPECIES: ABC transporter substrate-binding protein [Mycetocola]MCS4276329.1 putative spermidine/putrescine transport system substrate-binding protein [Mycetocola sp. BIGb0189]RLP79190.1 ABC transporter substrate-binding protein [Mycetocola lacteus]
MKAQRGWVVALAAAAIVTLGLSGCSADAAPADGGAKAATATSAKDLGGIDKLVEAAKAEGQLNVIALPEDWSNYGKIISGFEKKYGITVNSASPDAASAEEIKAAKDLKGQNTAPDVFDLGTAVTLANTDQFAKYQVENWADIPDANKEKSGLWYNDYTGVMSIGYDSNKVPAPTKLSDLLGKDYAGKVAINGDPTQAGAAFAAVGMATVQNGGTLDDYSKGIEFFSDLKKAGNFLPLDPTPATIASGETPVVFDWNYNNMAQESKVPGWKTVVLDGDALGSYYNQAINVDAPHPAAARLWQEWIYSDEVQNLYLQAGALPVRLAAMDKAGTVDKKALDAVGVEPTSLIQATPEQTEKAAKLLGEKWAAAVQ